MEFLETHWVKFLIGGTLLWAAVNCFKVTTTKDKAEMAVAELAGKEDWSSIHVITIRRQISIDATLQNVEIALATIVGLMLVLAFKLII